MGGKEKEVAKATKKTPATTLVQSSTQPLPPNTGQQQQVKQGVQGANKQKTQQVNQANQAATSALSRTAEILASSTANNPPTSVRTNAPSSGLNGTRTTSEDVINTPPTRAEWERMAKLTQNLAKENLDFLKDEPEYGNVLLKVDVKGTRLLVSRGTMEKLFGSHIDRLCQENDAFLINRDAYAFGLLLDYLSNPKAGSIPTDPHRRSLLIREARAFNVLQPDELLSNMSLSQLPVQSSVNPPPPRQRLDYTTMRWRGRALGIGKGQFKNVYGLAVHGGLVYVADWGDGKVSAWNQATGTLEWELKVCEPRGLAVAADGTVFVSCLTVPIMVMSSKGVVLGSLGTFGEGPGQFGLVEGMAFDPMRRLVVADAADRVVVLAGQGAVVGQWFLGGSPCGLACGPNGEVAVTLLEEQCVVVLEGERGREVRKWGGHGSAEGQLKHAFGVAIDRDGRVLVADYGNQRVQVFGGDGKFQGFLGGSSGKWGGGPKAIALDHDSGEVFVALEDMVTVWGDGVIQM